jgi:NitT/TauT family transport system substrate-binding protein
LAIDHIIGIDRGAAITIVSGVHGGCYELFAHGTVRTIADLKGKRVSEAGGVSLLIPMMAAWVGLDPDKDLAIVTDPAHPAKPMRGTGDFPGIAMTLV